MTTPAAASTVQLKVCSATSLMSPEKLADTAPLVFAEKLKLGLKRALLKATAPPGPIFADNVSAMPRLKFATARSAPSRHPKIEQ